MLKYSKNYFTFFTFQNFNVEKNIVNMQCLFLVGLRVNQIFLHELAHTLINSLAVNEFEIEKRL